MCYDVMTINKQLKNALTCTIPLLKATSVIPMLILSHKSNWLRMRANSWIKFIIKYVLLSFFGLHVRNFDFLCYTFLFNVSVKLTETYFNKLKIYFTHVNGVF